MCLRRVANVKAQRTIAWVLAQPIRMMAFGWVGWAVGIRGALHGKGNWHDRRLATIGFASATRAEKAEISPFPLSEASGSIISHISRMNADFLI